MHYPVVKVQIQRYRVSLWTHQFTSLENAPSYLRKETVASTETGALRNIMRQANIEAVYRAKVVTLRTGTCQWLEHISL